MQIGEKVWTATLWGAFYSNKGRNVVEEIREKTIVLDDGLEYCKLTGISARVVGDGVGRIILSIYNKKKPDDTSCWKIVKKTWGCTEVGIKGD